MTKPEGTTISNDANVLSAIVLSLRHEMRLDHLHNAPPQDLKHFLALAYHWGRLVERELAARREPAQ